MSQSATAILDQQELLDTLKAFKKGDFTVRMKTQGGGLTRDIAGMLNGLIELNQRLTKDLQRLSKMVGKDGKVTERASIGDVSGSWATCVDSVNSLISDLVKPTAEVTRVIGAVAKDDLSQAMPSRRRAALIQKNLELQAAETTLRERTRELAERVEDLARSNAELERFAYVASHDLREPLRMVTSYTKLLARRYKGKLDSDAEEFINFAVDGAGRMEQLIEDLLLYGRVGIRDLFFKPVQCEMVLTRALDNLQRALQETGALVTHDPLPTVKGDDTQLVQVFQNLIGNGIKFRGKMTPSVHVSIKEKTEDWVFAIQDNGIGIDPQYADRIFVIFQRLHSHAEYPGSGIGLAICKKVIENHDGRIWFESQPGEGTTFYFTIPKSDVSE
jgi:signal transduction histidine kinase